MAAVVPVTPPVAKSNVELAQLVIGEARIAMMSRNQEAMKRAMVSLQGVRYFAPAAVRGEIVQTLDELIVATGGHVSVDADVRPAW